MMFAVKHFPSRGQFFLFLQLQLSSVSAGLFKTFILGLLLTDFVLHATVTYFDFVSIEYAVIDVVSWEM